MDNYDKAYKFIFENRLLNICELNKPDINFILNKSYNIKFNLDYPAYINGKCYFKNNLNLNEKLIFNTVVLNGV
jgi:hypothetical protein